MSVVRQHRPPHDDRPCLCSVCTCGNHPCPGVACLAPLNATSSYRDHYPGQQPSIDERSCPSNRNQSALQNTRAAPGHFMTTNQAAQLAGRGIGADRAQSCKPRQTQVVPSPFNSNSSYKEDFPGHDPALHQSPRQCGPRQALQRTSALPGAFETTNQAANNAISQAHREGALQRSAPIKGKDSSPINHKLPFGASSTYRDQFPQHHVSESSRHLQDPSSLLRTIPENRDFHTTNSVAFQKPPHERAAQCPAAFVQRRPPSTDGHIKLTEVPDAFGNMTPVRTRQ